MKPKTSNHHGQTIKPKKLSHQAENIKSKGNDTITSGGSVLASLRFATDGKGVFMRGSQSSKLQALPYI